MRAEDLEVLREDMVAVIAANDFMLRDTIGKSALDERVMTAMGKVPRHAFVPIELQPYAYANVPLPIGLGKTISQPFIVALMTDLLDIKADDSVLEIWYRSWLSGRHPRAAGPQGILRRNHRRAWPSGETTTPTAGLQQCRTQDCQWLSRLVRARTL
jgi:Protein-L-isoaspartate(D-aspartate) O-methyltransferase (PCMT)